MPFSSSSSSSFSSSYSFSSPSSSEEEEGREGGEAGTSVSIDRYRPWKRFVDLSLGGALGGKVFLCHLWLRPQVDQSHFSSPLGPYGSRGGASALTGGGRLSFSPTASVVGGVRMSVLSGTSAGSGVVAGGAVEVSDAADVAAQESDFLQFLSLFRETHRLGRGSGVTRGGPLIALAELLQVKRRLVLLCPFPPPLLRKVSWMG